MREELKKYCDLFIENRKVAKAAFPFSATPTAGSIILTGKGESVDRDKLKKANDVLKEHEGVFSAFRNNIRVPVICLMAMADDPDEYIRRLRGTFDKLHEGKIIENEYNAITAMVLNQKADDSHIDEYIDKTREVYKIMKTQHPVLTGSNDMPFAGIIAATDKDPAEVMEKAEKCYKLLRAKFPVSEAVQPLSQILAITDGTAEELTAKTIELFDRFAEKGLKFSKGPELATLGSLAGLDISAEEIVAETKEVYEYLNQHKAYGFLETGKAEKVMFAAVVAMLSHNSANSENMLNTALSAQLALAIAIQLSIIIITTSVVTTVASNSN